MKFTVEIKGQDEAIQAIKNTAKALDPDVVEPVFMEGAKVIQTAAKSGAPKGETGNLFGSIKTKFLKQIGNNPRSAIAAVDRKKAPHAHLIEYGTAERYQKKGHKYVGHVPAHPFWRPAIDQNYKNIFNTVRNKLIDLVVKKFEGK